MTPQRELLRQGTQRRGAGFFIGFLGSGLRTSDAGGGLVVRLGVAGPDGRTTVELAPGESTDLPRGGSLRVVDIFVSPDGTQTAAAVEIVEPTPPSGAGA